MKKRDDVQVSWLTLRITRVIGPKLSSLLSVLEATMRRRTIAVAPLRRAKARWGSIGVGWLLLRVR